MNIPSRIIQRQWNVFERASQGPTTAGSVQHLDSIKAGKNSTTLNHISNRIRGAGMMMKFDRGNGSRGSSNDGNNSHPSSKDQRPDEMNIFCCTDIVSKAFVWSRIKEAEDKRQVVRLIFEDLIDDMDTGLMVAVLELLSCDDRKWERIRFVDGIDVPRYGRWKQKKNVLLNHLKDVGNFPLMFQANMEVVVPTCKSLPQDMYQNLETILSQHQAEVAKTLLANRQVSNKECIGDDLSVGTSTSSSTKVIRPHPNVEAAEFIQVLRLILKDKRVVRLFFGGALYPLEANDTRLWTHMVRLFRKKAKVDNRRINNTRPLKVDGDDEGEEEDEGSDGIILLGVIIRIKEEEEYAAMSGMEWRTHLKNTLPLLEDIAGIISEEDGFEDEDEEEDKRKHHRHRNRYRHQDRHHGRVSTRENKRSSKQSSEHSSTRTNGQTRRQTPTRTKKSSRLETTDTDGRGEESLGLRVSKSSADEKLQQLLYNPNHDVLVGDGESDTTETEDSESDMDSSSNYSDDDYSDDSTEEGNSSESDSPHTTTNSPKPPGVQKMETSSGAEVRNITSTLPNSSHSKVKKLSNSPSQQTESSDSPPISPATAGGQLYHSNQDDSGKKLDDGRKSSPPEKRSIHDRTTRSRSRSRTQSTITTEKRSIHDRTTTRSRSRSRTQSTITTEKRSIHDRTTRSRSQSRTQSTITTTKSRPSQSIGPCLRVPRRQRDNATTTTGTPERSSLKDDPPGKNSARVEKKNEIDLDVKSLGAHRKKNRNSDLGPTIRRIIVGVHNNASSNLRSSDIGPRTTTVKRTTNSNHNSGVQTNESKQRTTDTAAAAGQTSSSNSRNRSRQSTSRTSDGTRKNSDEKNPSQLRSTSRTSRTRKISDEKNPFQLRSTSRTSRTRKTCDEKNPSQLRSTSRTSRTRKTPLRSKSMH